MLSPHKSILNREIMGRATKRMGMIPSDRGQQEILAAFQDFARVNDEQHAVNLELAAFIEQQQAAIAVLKQTADTLRETTQLLTEQNGLLKDIMRAHGIELPADPTIN